MPADALKKMELRVINKAIWARGMVPNGHYLCSDRERAPAMQMVERGFLTKPTREGDFDQTGMMYVIMITDENYAAVKAALQ